MSKLSSAARSFSKTLSLWQRGIRVRFDTKEMANEGYINDVSTTNVRLDGEKKNR